MARHNRFLSAGVAVAAVVGALAACGNSSGKQPAPAGTTATGSQPASAPASGTTGSQQAAPVLSRTLDGIQIFDGAAAAPIVPPANPAKGTNNMQLNATANALTGTYLSDTAGRTLYRFDKDTANPSVSNCNGGCATTWPPLLVTSPGKIYTNGVAPSLVGYVKRADGTLQVTVNGSPVYYFSKDTKAGDLLGQLVGNTWYAVNPQGGRTSAVAPAAASGQPGAS